MWRSLLPDTCATAVAAEPAAARLSRAEEARLSTASACRQAEFRAGRAAAAAALRALGMPRPGTIGVGREGQPLWPAGFVGSITHTPGHCAATVARSDHFRGLGIDVEACEPLDEALRPIVLDERERAMLGEVPGGSSPLCKLLFCAKEAVFKCLYPSIGQFLDFDDVSVSLDTATGRFSASIRARTGPRQIGGRFAADLEYVYVSAIWPA